MSERDDEKEQKEQKDRDEKQRQNDLRKQIDVEHVWNQVDINEDRIDPGVDDSPGWKTVRIFVSSTFKDFHQEREILIKEVSRLIGNFEPLLSLQMICLPVLPTLLYHL